MKKFNLKNFKKNAFYDNAMGALKVEDHAWQICQKIHLDKGMSLHEAMSKCLESYQNSKNKSDWLLTYANSKKGKNIN